MKKSILKQNTINLEDVVQVIVGSSALSVPVAFSEESWKLSHELPWGNIAALVAVSLIFINLYSIQGIFQGKVKHRFSYFLIRTMIDYFITFSVVLLILFLLNRLPLFSEPVIALKRVVILSFPASMGGVVVDSFDKE